MCPDWGTVLWLGCVSTGVLLVPLHTSQVSCSSAGLWGFSIHVLLNNQPLCCANWMCVCDQPLCSFVVCVSAKNHCRNLLSSCPFQDAGEMEPARLSTLRQAWEGCQCGSACFGIRKCFSPTLYRKRVHVSQAAFSSVVCSLRPWPPAGVALRSRGTSNEKVQPYFLNSSSF